MLKKEQRGSIYITVLIIMTLFVSLGILATTYVGSQAKISSQKKYKAMSFEIAEAGTEYYRWHLAHANEDYQDGTAAPGPYTHDYKNATGETIGQFVLNITPPPNGSTVVNLQSNGHIILKPTLQKSIKVTMGIPSFATYAVAANDIMRFGEGTEVFGPIHSNEGIRFDGFAHNVVSSHVPSYDDPDHSDTSLEFGVHTHRNTPPPTPNNTVNDNFRPLEGPPTVMQSRTDVFGAGRVVGADTINFTSITRNLSDMQTEAGLHLSASGAQGYHLTLRVDGKVDIHKVNSQLYCQYNSSGTWRDFGYCSNNFNRACYQDSICNNFCSENESRYCTTDSTCSTNGEGTCVLGNTCTKSSHSIGTTVNGSCQTGTCNTGTCSAGSCSISTCQNNPARSCTTNGNCNNYCTGNPSRSCTTNGNCNNYCTGNPSRSCTTNGNCNNYCTGHASRSCTTNANCNNYCSSDTLKTCTVTGNCVNYCSGDRSRSCFGNNQTQGNARCNGWCTGDHSRGCSGNGDCTGVGVCDSTAPDVGPCTRSSTGPCITTDTCALNDTCTLNDLCETSGVCTTASCSINADCTLGGTCQTANCSASTACASGTCQYGSCTTDPQCPNSGTCQRPACTKDSLCADGNLCSSSEAAFTYNSASSVGVDLPSNGLIFAEDDVWVDGTIDGARLTIVAAKLPLASGNANIYINKDLKYTHTDGTDAIGLIAQNNVLVGYFSEDDLRLDGALIAQNGRTGRPYYGAYFTTSTNAANFRITPAGSLDPSSPAETSCMNYRRRTQITARGSLGTYQRYGFAWTGYDLFSCPGGLHNNSGYCTRNLIYDNNFYFAPPPYFPTTGQYRVISWEEQ
jgi:hypothetical protein